MNLKEYSENINKLAKEHPDATVVYAVDDEGNAFGRVYYAPSVGFYSDDGFEAEPEDNKQINAVCIN